MRLISKHCLRVRVHHIIISTKLKRAVIEICSFVYCIHTARCARCIVGRLVKYSGYGNAAGLLARRGLLGGGQMRKTHRRPTKNEEAAAAAATLQSDSLSDESETEEYASLKDQYACACKAAL